MSAREVMNGSSAVFLDDRAALTGDVPYDTNAGLIHFREGALDCLRLLQQAGHQLIIVSNQPGVAQGLFAEEDLEPVEAFLRQALASSGVFLSGYYYCPHDPQAEVREYAVHCLCRRPRPGLIYRAAGEHSIDLERSWMLGDALEDIEAGNRAHCRTVLIDNHYETEARLSSAHRPGCVVGDLQRAVGEVLR